MARNIAKTPVRVAWATALCSIALGTTLWTASSGAQMPEGMPPLRARVALTQAHDLYKRADYENAARLYHQAQVAESELTPRERQDLAKLAQQNNIALQMRREGAALITQADDALRAGRQPEAAKLLRLATANQFLSPADRQALAVLNEQVQQAGPMPGGAADSKVTLKGTDAKHYLDGARDALKNGELELAEALAKDAEKAASAFTFTPWGDSPAKVRRDIQAARAKQPAMPPLTAPAPSAPQFSTAAPERTPDGKQPSPAMQKVRDFLTPSWLRDRTDGDQGVKPADFPVPEQPMKTPAENISHRIPHDLAPVTNVPTGDAKAHAVRLINEGYEALKHNDLETARQKAYQAKTLRPDLNWTERNPDRLLADIQRREAAGPAPKTPTKNSGTPSDARSWLKQARAAMQKEQYDEAEHFCEMAAGVSGVRGGLFEDSPERLRADLKEARTRHNRDKATALLTEGRKFYTQGNYAEARVKAQQAHQLHGPYYWWEMGDRPQKLLEDIHRAEGGKGKAPALPSDNLAQRPETQGQRPDAQAQRPGLPPVNLVSATTQTANRNRAKTLILEARQLEQNGFLVEARQKALEADALNVSYGADEDSPRQVMLSLASKCDRRITQLLQQATDFVQNNPNDATRFQKAEVNLLNARKLAESFGLDPSTINQHAQWLQQAAGRAGAALRPIAATDTPGAGVVAAEQRKPLDPQAERLQQVGLEKLNKARLEIKNGNYVLGRRIAEEAFNPTYGVQQEAGMVLRTIDAEENLHQMTTAQKNFDAGMEAYGRKDYARAAKVWEAVDLRLLAPEKRRQLAELLELPEMRGGGVITASSRVPAGPITREAGKASVTDIPDGFKSYTAMEQIHAHQLRDRSLEAMDQAFKLVQDKEMQKAVDTLREFLAQLNEAPVNQNLLTPVRRQVEQKLQQYSTLLAQQQLVEQQRHLGTGKENQRNIKAHKLHEDVAQLLNEGRQLYKEQKYEQALAKVRTAKELDPDNATVDFFLGQIDIQIRQARWNNNRKINEDYNQRALNNDIMKDVDFEKPLHIDTTALTRARQRKAEALAWQTKDPVEREIERKLEEPIQGVHWKDTPLSVVLDDLRKMSGVTIVPDRLAFREANINLDMPVELPVENIKLKSVLNLLLGQAKLTYVIKNQALVITTEERAKDSKTRMIVHPVADLVVPVENHPLPEIANLSSALMRHINTSGNVNYSGTTPFTPPMGLVNGMPTGHYANGMAGTPAGQTAPGATPPRVPGQTLEHVLINLIKNSIARNSWEEDGGPGRIQYYPLGMALVVNQTLEVQEEVAALLQALRRLQDLEVAIEMRLVNVSEAFFERMGMDFDINIKTPHSRFEQNLISGQFAPFGSINRNLGVNGVVSGLTPAGTLTPDLNIPLKNSSFDFSVPPFGGFPGTLGQDGGLSLGLAFLNDIQVFMFLEAAQGDRRTNVMQAPKLTVFNGQTAFMTINDTQFFLTGVQIAVPTGGNQLIFVPVQQPFPLGVSMQVTPVVSADRRFVRIELFPNLTNLASATVPLIPVSIPVPQFFDGPGNNSSTNTQPQVFTMFFQQPIFTTINLSTTVRVPDGGTVLLGGLKTLSEARNEHGPPILSKIPYISRLFRNIGYGREAQSLMIMVTPRIIINEEEELIHLGDLPPIPGRGGI